MKLIKYFIKDCWGRGLHYIQGKQYWRDPNSIEDVENFTSFETSTEARDFAADRNIIDFYSVGKIIIYIE